MTIRIEKSIASGKVKAPPSKSMAHRYLICGALSQNSEIKGISESKDMVATIGCLKELGATIEKDGEKVKIGGIDFNKNLNHPILNCYERSNLFAGSFII